MKKAFTLLELLVVIAIIGILMIVLFNLSTKVINTGRNAKCLANLHNLAMACSTYQMRSGNYPLAGSYEQASNISENNQTLASEMLYDEKPAWISWYSRGKYAYNKSWDTSKKIKEHISESTWYSSSYTRDQDEADYCLTNGVLWTSGCATSRELFLCPLHINSAGARPTWSYVMNAAFQWLDIDEDDNGYINALHGMGGPLNAVGGVARPDKTLLFAELQFKSVPGIELKPRSGSPGYDFDCVLQSTIDPEFYGNNFYAADPAGHIMPTDGDECIGFNHGDGKLIYAHVCFVDAHVEKIVYPTCGMSDEQRAELTKWLCNGLDVSFDGKEYKEFKEK